MSEGGPKLLLIDGNNMCHRMFWAARSRKDGKKGDGIGLTYKGRCVDVIYGFFMQLISLHKKYPDHFRVIAWDAGYDRRLAESRIGVEKGIIPSEYKATRPKRGDVSEDGIDMEPLFEQMEEIQVNGLSHVKCLQVRIPGVEADDILYTYARTYAEWGGSSVIVSTDQDFFQAIDDRTVLYRHTQKEWELWTAERFRMEFGFEPYLWADAGAIMGETGKTKDNIHGVDGWGAKTACQYVREHGNIEAIKAAIEAKEKRGKREEGYLNQWERLLLAKSLKQMTIIPNVPKPRCFPKDEKAMRRYFLEWSFASILKEAWRLV